MTNRIEKGEIVRAQQIWAEKFTGIGNAYIQKKDYQALAKNMVDELYGYQEGTVLFKPTRASEKQFRLTAESAVCYFIGENPEFLEDEGFALVPWKSVDFHNAGFILNENYAVAMGNYFFHDFEGNQVKVEYTFGYFRSSEGRLKINLHHSSLPFQIYRENT
jgi:hypothetical protein